MMESTIYGEWRTQSAEETRALGRRVGESAVPGLIVLLDGDLGAGKTVFAKGVAEGLGVSEHVNSPTFTILQVYESGRLPLYHFDVYRIGDPEEMDEIGLDEYLFGRGVCLIEWPEMIADLLPEDCVRVRISRVPGGDFDARQILVVRGTAPPAEGQ